MPLRDHFRPPISEHRSWEGFHGGWPMVIVQKLVPLLPPGFVAEPRVRLGASYEVDIGALEDAVPGDFSSEDAGGGTAVLTDPVLAPTWTIEAELAEPYEYEVLVYDERESRKLVAAIEIISPGNKDRPEARAAFAAKAAALLQRGVCVSVVDLVTVRQFNLYVQMLFLCAQKDPTVAAEPPEIYAATARARPTRGANGHRKILDTWFFPLAIGRPLPPIPLLLGDDLRVVVNLEESYEETCRVLRIR